MQGRHAMPAHSHSRPFIFTARAGQKPTRPHCRASGRGRWVEVGEPWQESIPVMSFSAARFTLLDVKHEDCSQSRKLCQCVFSPHSASASLPPLSPILERAYLLVPKLCLGTHVLEALLPLTTVTHAKQSFAPVRSQAELGNEERHSAGFFFSPLITRKPMYSGGGGASPRLSSAGQMAQRPIALPLSLSSA